MMEQKKDMPQMGEFRTFEGENVTIYHGDCMDVLRDAIPDGSVNLLFADPPYNIGKNFSTFKDRWASDKEYAEWCYQWMELCLRKITSTGSLYVMSSTQAIPYLDIWLRERVTILSRIIWSYDSSGVQAKKYFGSLYEPILHCVADPDNYVFNSSDIEVEATTGSVRKLVDYRKSTPTLYNSKKVPGNVWYFTRVRYRMPEYEEHPSQKPESLMERIIRASSNAGDTVLDPFSGTFTTCAVARQLGRRSIGIELQRDYVKIGLRRLGVTDHLDGEKLSRPLKNTVRKNGKVAPVEAQKELFDVQV